MIFTTLLPFPNPSFISPTSHKKLAPKQLRATSSISLDLPPPKSTPTPHLKRTGVIIIGAGLAGLAAATRLTAENIPFILVEASDAVGGRVRTEAVDGFLLDRGFQIFITGYPEAQKVLDYEALELCKFYSGARVFYDGRFHTVADPIRHFFDSIRTLTNPIGTLIDKLLVGIARVIVLLRSDEDIFSGNEISTLELLMKTGFSDSIIEKFFVPFFGGIFFDKNLETSSRMFNFILKCLARGDNTLPANGISAIPEQLAAKLPQNSILLNSRVVSVDSGSVKLQNGDMLKSEHGVIVAVEEPETVHLLTTALIDRPVLDPKQCRSTVCVYFSADKGQIPTPDPVLYLNGSGKGVINNMFFATNVAPSYGPPDKALISVSLIGSYDDMVDENLTAEIVRDLSGWFGLSSVMTWQHLKTYRIGFAQPNQSPPTNPNKDPRIGTRLYVCGDYLTSATFDGALVSGRKAVEALLQDMAYKL